MCAVVYADDYTWNLTALYGDDFDGWHCWVNTGDWYWYYDGGDEVETTPRYIVYDSDMISNFEAWDFKFFLHQLGDNSYVTDYGQEFYACVFGTFMYGGYYPMYGEVGIAISARGTGGMYNYGGHYDLYITFNGQAMYMGSKDCGLWNQGYFVVSIWCENSMTYVTVENDAGGIGGYMSFNGMFTDAWLHKETYGIWTPNSFEWTMWSEFFPNEVVYRYFP